MICTNLNSLYLQRGVCFDYVEKFTLLVNNLDGSMKLLPGKYPPGNLLRNFPSYENPNNEHYPIRKRPL